MKAALRGTEIYFDIAGMQLAPVGAKFIERPVVFVLHGGPGGDHTRFKQHSLELQKVAQLVFIDHRGCGRSKKTRAADYTLENNIEDIEALRKHLGLQQICILGTSYGGMVAQGYAIRYPKRVSKLILVCTAPSYRFIEEAKKTLQQRGNAAQITITEHLWNGTFKDAAHIKKFFTLMDPLYSNLAKQSKKSEFGKPSTLWSPAPLNQGFAGFLRHFDFIPKLRKISCPTLILGGEDDWIISPNQVKTLAKHIPHATLKIFKNCSHAVATDAHEAYIKIVTRFLRG
ncbi:MAG TPA: alpha/beta fold hydrolase [Gammaproteobacteria bacterium]|nr:alpha/beta fold hydrolase [Gammaproteobacteria bacterium]